MQIRELMKEADTLIAALGGIGYRYQALAEGLMYGEHGVRSFGDDPSDEVPPFSAPPFVADFERGQAEASRDFATLNFEGTIQSLSSYRIATNALRQLHDSVGTMVRSTDLGTKEGRADGAGLKAIFEVDVASLEKKATDELDEFRQSKGDQSRRATSYLVRPLARTDDGDLAVGPTWMDVTESADFIREVIARMREPYRGFTELAPGRFRPNDAAGFADPDGDGVQLYVEEVILYVGTMTEVVSAWVEGRLLYNTTSCDDDGAIDDMCAAVAWIGGWRWGW